MNNSLPAPFLAAYPALEEVISRSDNPNTIRKLIRGINDEHPSFEAELNMLLTTGAPTAQKLASKGLMFELEYLAGLYQRTSFSPSTVDYRCNLIENHVWAKWTIGNFLEEQNLTDMVEMKLLTADMYDLLTQTHRSISDDGPAPAGEQRMVYWRGLNIACIAFDTITDKDGVDINVVREFADWAGLKNNTYEIVELVEARQTLNPEQLEAVMKAMQEVDSPIRDGVL